MILSLAFVATVCLFWAIIPAVVNRRPKVTHYREDGPVSIDPEFRGVIHIKSREITR